MINKVFQNLRQVQWRTERTNIKVTVWPTSQASVTKDARWTTTFTNDPKRILVSATELL